MHPNTRNQDDSNENADVDVCLILVFTLIFNDNSIIKIF